MRALIFALLLAPLACATTPTDVLGLLDARGDLGERAAVDKAAKILDDPKQRNETRATAAKVLGRLRVPTDPALEALSKCLSGGQPGALTRAWCAYALGEMRSEASLAPLVEGLRQPLDATTLEQVLEGLAKHFVILSADPDRVLEVVEAMIFAVGNQSTNPPPIYDLLGAKTRTVEVNIQVLLRAIEAASGNDPPRRAALYQATTELLDRLRFSRAEIVAGPEAWRARVKEAIAAANRTMTIEDRRQRTLVLLTLGTFGDLPELGRPAAATLLGANERLDPALLGPGLELTGAWAASRLEMNGPGLRRALLVEIVSRSSSRDVLRLIGDLVIDSESIDSLQRILRLEGGP